jgi:hypothetical protein
MKTLTSAPTLPIVLDARTVRPNRIATGFETITNPGGSALEEIRHRAYSIWESAGRPAHCEAANWLAAEAEVMSERDS